MAYSRNNAAQSQSEDWKAQAFINYFIVREDGSKVKIGYTALKDSKKLDAALIAKLTDNPEGVAALNEKLVAEFNLADDGKEMDLGL